jgi:tripartite-type tricarboxylate transporter receptor subunit TctC
MRFIPLESADGLAVAATMTGALAAAPAAGPLFSHLRIIVPSGPGGGLDATARALQRVRAAAGVARTASVENVPGRAALRAVLL